MSYPSLHSQFFKDHPPAADWFRLWSDKFEWDANILPVYEWEGLLYVACSQPEILRGEWPAHWILLQALPEDLEAQWSAWHVPKANKKLPLQEVTRTSTRELTKTSTKTVQTANVGFSPDELMQNLQSEIEDPDIESDNEANPDVSKLNRIETDSDVVELLEGLVPEAPPEIEMPLTESKFVPEGTFDIETLTQGINQEAKAPTKRVGPKISLQRIDTATAAPATISAAPLASRPSQVQTPAPPKDDLTSTAVKANITHQVSHQASNQLSPQASMVKSQTPPTPPAKKKSLPAGLTLPMEPANKVSANSIFADVTATLPAFYETTLVATKAGNSMRIIYWPDTVPPAKHRDFDFSLGTPSPFRIALRTEKPYHGYVVENPFLTQFFAQWNGGKNPDTLTVIPLIRDSAVVGFMISLGRAEAFDSSVLHTAEDTAKQVLDIWPYENAA